MSEIPGDLKFLKSHEWARVEGDGKVTVGISDHAQGLLGDLVYVELPNVGDRVEAGNACAVVESVKAASDVYCAGHRQGRRGQRRAGRQARDDQRGRLRRRLDLRGRSRGARAAQRTARPGRLCRTARGRRPLIAFGSLLQLHLLRPHSRPESFLHWRIAVAPRGRPSRSIGPGLRDESLPVLRVRGTRIANDRSAPATTRIFSFVGVRARRSASAELLAQFCANQLVRRAIGGAGEKYF